MRKTIEYLVEEGADKGKLFFITRMSASDADKWALRFIKALADAGDTVRPDSLELGILGIDDKYFDLIGHVEESESEVLLEALLKCCQIKRDPRNPSVEPTKILSVDIEDAQTLSILRRKAYELHTDFIKAAMYQLFHLVAALGMTETPENGKK
ncbi:hypothetical protein FAI40_04690 [Acetobacteraceae bacterium]|nr:hypothetical protein FAI40_04690 [Acetobacteraceae bacterium]